MWAAIVIIIVALLLVLAAPKPKIENARAANLGDFDFPRSKEGDPVPWFRGTVRLRSPNSLWYGDYTPVPIKKKQKTGLFSSKKVTVGYKYHIGLDLCWSLGGAHTVVLRKLWSDKHVFWTGTQSTAGTLNINLPNLFGGEEQRGGMVGSIEYYPGSFSEVKSSYLAGKADPDVPAYIGQCRTVFKGNGSTQASGFYFGTTTNINTINAEASCYSADVHPTYSIMPNGLDVNPMELLYAGFTQRFGMIGVSTDSIDMTSWQRDAETLYNEGMGMSLLIQSTITGKDLCEEVLRIADGILYQDNDTGKMVSCLIRKDYVVEDLPVFEDKLVIKELVNFTKTTWEQAYNQCRVTFKDRANEYADRVAIQQDFALLNFQSKIRNTDISVPGCFVNEQAVQLAARQLSLMSVPLFQIEIRCNRKASLIKPGQCFVFNWAPYGLSNMVMRVQRIDKGTLTNGDVTIHAVQDRFATALAVFAPPTGSGWTPINTDAQPVTIRRFFETPKWFHQFFETQPATNQAAWYVAAKPPGTASVGMDIETSAAGTYGDVLLSGDDYPYNGTFVLIDDFLVADGFTDGYSSTGFTVELVDLPLELRDQAGTFDATAEWMILVDNEWMQPADIIDNGNGTYEFRNVYRALLDSKIADHTTGTRGYLVKQSDGLLTNFTSNTGTLYARIRDRTPDDTLPVADALTNTVVADQRAYRPAPPDYVRIDGSRTPSSVLAGGTVSLSWRYRNRNTLTIIPYNAASETQEAGVDYGWRSRVGLGSWSPYTYVASSPVSVAVPGTPGIVEYEVISRRDGIASLTGDSCFVQATIPAPTSDFPDAVLALNPTWYAQHNEPATSTTAINYGTGADGTYVTDLSDLSAPIFTGGDVCWNNAVGDYCNIPASVLPAGADEFTLLIMVNEAVLNNYQALIDRDDEGVIRKWQWRLDSSGVQNFIQIISGVSTVSGTGAAVATTALLGVRVKTDGECTIWKNGEIVTTGSVPTGLDWGHNTTGLRVLRRLQGDSINTAKCAASIIYDYAVADADMLILAQEAGLHV